MRNLKHKWMLCLLALLCALQLALPITALASGASVPTRVPDIGEAVTVYTKDDYILDFSSAGFSVMDAGGNELSGGVSGLQNVMKIWVHTADGQKFTAYCLNMARHYPPTIAAGDEANIGMFPVNFTTVAWPAGANYDKMLWVVEHTYPAIPMDVMMSDAGASFSRLASEIQNAQSISASEAETLAESVVYATIQQAIWHHQPAEITEGSGTYIGARMLGGNQDLKLLYAYLVKDRPAYVNYRNGTLGNSINIDHGGDMTPRQEGDGYVFGPFSISTSMLSAGDVQLGHTGAGSLTPRFTDAAGNALGSVRQNELFYVRVDQTPTEPITITVQANTANALTLDANRGRMYMSVDPNEDVQPVGTGGVPHTTTAAASLTLPTINPPALPVTANVTLHKYGEDGEPLAGAMLELENAAGVSLGVFTTDDSGSITVRDLPIGTYTFHETQPPAGYALDSAPQSFTVTETGEITGTTQLSNRLIRASAVIRKTDENGNPLAGAKIEVKNANGVSLGVFTTGADGTIAVNNLLAGTYTFREVEAPAGYVLNHSEQTFIVSATGEVTGSTQLLNSRARSQAIIKKVDDAGKPLAGAKFEVWDANGDSIGIFTTGEDGTVAVNNLLPGSYTFKEIQAPAGYVLDNTVRDFVVSPTGEVTGTLQIANRPIKATAVIKKVDEAGKPLAGATIVVKDNGGNIVKTAVTGMDGVITVDDLALGGKYTYYESKAPIGYTLNDAKYSFSVDRNGAVSKITDIVNKKTVTPVCSPCPPIVTIPTVPVLEIPQTGDASYGAWYGAVMMCVAAAAAMLVLKRKSAGK